MDAHQRFLPRMDAAIKGSNMYMNCVDVDYVQVAAYSLNAGLLYCCRSVAMSLRHGPNTWTACALSLTVTRCTSARRTCNCTMPVLVCPKVW
jgi:hypothetical protein